MADLSEGNALPPEFSSWQEYRAAYQSYYSEYVEMRTDRISFRACLNILRLDQDTITKIMDEALNDRNSRWKNVGPNSERKV